MPQVEVRIAPKRMAAQMDEMRRWMAARGIKATKFTSTGSSDEALVIVEFASANDAAAFAREFSGILAEG